MKYIKKPIIIEAVQFTRDNINEIRSFCGEIHTIKTPRCINGKMTAIINTLEGKYNVIEGDYIIKGIQGEFYPCKEDIFEMTYEVI